MLGRPEIDVPVFTCLRASLRDVLESLGGRQLEQFDPPLSSGLPRPPQQPHVTAVPLEDVPSGTGRRIYVGGEAVALFNCDGRFFAVSDRCSHARASLSDGTVDIATCILTCPWHQGMFDLRTGRPAGGPPVVPLRTYEVTIDGNRAVIGPQPHSPAGTSAPRA